MENNQFQKFDPKITYPKSHNSSQKGGFFMHFMKDQAYSKATKNILQQISKKIKTGQLKSLFEITKPIQMCDCNTYLQIISNQFFAASKYFRIAYKEVDPVKIIQWLVIASIAGITANLHNLAGRVPLDSMLGQTFQGQDDDGTIIEMQCIGNQVQPKLLILISNPSTGLFVKSYLETVGQLNGVNSIRGFGRGHTIFKDNKNKEYIIDHVPMVVDKIVVGDPTFYLNGPYKIRLPSEHIQAQVKFDGFNNEYVMTKMAKSLIGMLSRKQQKSRDSLVVTISKTKLDKQGKQQKIIVSKGSGSWLSIIQFDNLIYWKYSERIITWKKFDEKLQLPSDSRKRRDKLLMLEHKMAEAQKQKLEIEKLDKADRLLRKKKK